MSTVSTLEQALQSTRRLDRRYVLVAGAGATLAALLPSTASAAKEPAKESGSPVGYIAGSENMRTLGQAAPWLGSSPLSVVPASSVAPDRTLVARPVPMHIHGVFPRMPGKTDPTLAGVLVDAIYPAGASRLPFGAWSMSCRPAGKCASSVRFPLPADTSGGVELRFTFIAPDGRRTKLNTRLDAKPAGGPQLRRGFYLFGLRAGLWSKPTILNPGAPADLANLSLVVSVGMAA